MKLIHNQKILASAFLLWILISPLNLAGQDDANPPEHKFTADELFDANQILDVQVDIAPENWKLLCNEQRSFVHALGRELPESPFTNFKADLTLNGVRIPNVGIRKKGFLGSLDTVRPSLKIDFSEYEKQEPIDGLDRLTLNNNKQDAGRMCQYLSYKMFNESGTVAPRCGFARVTVNGEYLGIYSNVESIRDPFLKHGFGDDSGVLFEGTVTDFIPDWIAKFEPKNKKSDVKDLVELADLLATKEVDLARLGEVVDIEAFVRFWAMESLIGFWDGYCHNQNNYFIYRNPDNSKFYFIPWGADSAFTKTSPLPPYQIRPRSVHANAILANKLYRIPEIQDLYQTTLMSFLDNPWNEEKLLAEVERLEAMLKVDLEKEDAGYAGALLVYRRFIDTRRKEIMEEFEDGPPVIKTRHRIPAYFVEIGKATVSFTTQWYDSTPRELDNLGEVQFELKIDGENLVLENPGVYAEYSKWPSTDPEKPASVVFTGTRPSDGKRLTFGTGLPALDFREKPGQPVDIGGIYIEGNSFLSPGGGMRMIGGRATFEKASMIAGEPVIGKMELTIVELKSGQAPARDDE